MIIYKNLEKNLQELMLLGFEYSTYSSLCFSLKDYLNILPNKITKYLNYYNNKSNKYLKILLNNFSYNKFYNILLLLYIFKIKLKKSQFIQISQYKGIIDKNIKSTLLHTNLLKGLNIQHYIYSCFSARNSILSTGLITADIGYLMKKLIECLRSLYIKELSCNNYFNLKYNKILNYNNKKYNIKQIYKIFLCNSLKNICSKCLLIKSKINNIIGYNKGILSSQAICEPRLQSALRTFHIGCLKTNINITSININLNKYFFNHNKNIKNKLFINNKYISIIFNKKYNNNKLIFNYNYYNLIYNNNIINYKNIYNQYYNNNKNNIKYNNIIKKLYSLL